MKKVVFILVALMACSSAFAQDLKPTVDPYRFDLVFDSIQIPDTFTQQGLTPSHYMKLASQARTISIASAGVSALGCFIGVKQAMTEPDGDHSMATAVTIIGGAAAIVSYIVGLVYDNKAADAMASVKLTGNGVTISF